MTICVASVAVTVSVEEAPDEITVGFAVMVTVGTAGVMAGLRRFPLTHPARKIGSTRKANSGSEDIIRERRFLSVDLVHPKFMFIG